MKVKLIIGVCLVLAGAVFVCVALLQNGSQSHTGPDLQKTLIPEYGVSGVADDSRIKELIRLLDKLGVSEESIKRDPMMLTLPEIGDSFYELGTCYQ